VAVQDATETLLPPTPSPSTPTGHTSRRVQHTCSISDIGTIPTNSLRNRREIYAFLFSNFAVSMACGLALLAGALLLGTIVPLVDTQQIVVPEGSLNGPTPFGTWKLPAEDVSGAVASEPAPQMVCTGRRRCTLRGNACQLLLHTLQPLWLCPPERSSSIQA
jgi:hypothetical protein